MRVYIAAPWTRKAEAQYAADQCVAAGLRVSSTWHGPDHPDTTDPAELQRQARHDINGVTWADALIILNLEKSEGKATEMGFALGLGMPVVAVGNRSNNIFYHLPEVRIVDTIEEAINALRG